MEIVLRALIVFFALWVVLRALGKRELGEMSAFELLFLVVLGDLVQQGITQEDHSMTGALLAVGTLTLVVAATSYVSFRFKRPSEMLENIPSIVVNQGRFVDEVIRVERVTHDEILEAARKQGIADLRDVRVGVLENDGRFSFVLHTEPSPPRRVEEQLGTS